MKKISNNEVDKKLILKNLPIIRLGDYVLNRVKIQWKCAICDNIWMATPNNVLDQGTKCPKCYGSHKLTNNVIDERIKKYNIYRVSDYKNNNKDILLWGCYICDNIWESTVHNILDHSIRKCPFCAGNKKKDNKYLDDFITKNMMKIERIDDYTNNRNKLRFRCLVSGKIFLKRPEQILYNKEGCLCCKNKKENKVNAMIDDICKKYKLSYDRQVQICINDRKVIVDFVINTNYKKIYIEYDGEQHYRCVYFRGKKTICDKNRCEKKFYDQIKRDNDLFSFMEMNQLHFVNLPFWLTDDEIYSIILKEINE